MLKSFRKSGSNPLVFATLAILIIGLIGFGGRVGTGVSASGVAAVGSQSITTDDYVRAMQNALTNMSQQIGQEITLQQAVMLFQVDQKVMDGLVTNAALDDKARDLGISIGDANVRDSLVRTPAFQGVTGKFDNEAYKFALERLNLTPAEYETTIRKGTARDLIRTGISAGTVMPASAAATLLAFSGEKRAFDWLTLQAADLPVAVAEPTAAQAQVYYDAHNDQFMSPETRDITYLALRPSDLTDQVTVTDEQLQEAYDARIDEFNIPETRAVERLAFATEADATAALARITAGTATFETLVSERDLQLTDLDLGIIKRKDLDPEAQAVVFDPTSPGVYGPAVTLLGPALFRVNGIFNAQSTSLEQATPQLKTELALDDAAKLLADATVKLDDFLAGGATFEEIAAESSFKLANIAWHETVTDGIAADPAFQADAAAAVEGEDRDPVNLLDGGIAVLRLDGITAPALRPFAEVSAQATAALKAETETAKIAEYASTLKSTITQDKTLAQLAAEKGLALQPAEPVVRAGTIASAPAALVGELFKLANGEATVVSGPGRADIVQLNAITAFDPNAEENKALVAEANRQLAEQVGNDLFAVFAAQAQQEAGVSINAPVVQALLDRFQ